MKASILVRSLALLLAMAFPAIANIKVQSAYYGRPSPGKSVEVGKVVQQLYNSGRTSFRLSPAIMGASPNPGLPNFLKVEYYLNGKKVTGTATDGELFTFAGTGPAPKPPAPGAARLRILNNLGVPVYAYSIDRWGRWNWGQQIVPSGIFNTNSHIGQRWVITRTNAARIIHEFTLKPGDNRIVLDRNSVPGIDIGSKPMGGGEVRLRFENTAGRVLYLYQLDRWNSWQWKAQLDLGGVYAVNARIGEQWIAADQKGRIVQQIKAGPGMSLVRLGR
jgi:hypothetical protein